MKQRHPHNPGKTGPGETKYPNAAKHRLCKTHDPKTPMYMSAQKMRLDGNHQENRWREAVSDTKSELGALVGEETGGNHRDDLDVTNTKTHKEALEASVTVDACSDFHHAETMAIADYTTDLHASSYDF
jgi:hypothetical protein